MRILEHLILFVYSIGKQKKVESKIEESIPFRGCIAMYISSLVELLRFSLLYCTSPSVIRPNINSGSAHSNLFGKFKRIWSITLSERVFMASGVLMFLEEPY